MKMDIGIYSNIFEVSVLDEAVNIMQVENSRYPVLRDLRSDINQHLPSTRVYCDHTTSFIYGYGDNAGGLTRYGFNSSEVELREVPKFTSRLILEGLSDRLQQDGFEATQGKGRLQAFNFDEPIPLSNPSLKFYRGYDLRSIYLFDQIERRLCFALIIDIAYTCRDSQNNPLNTHIIRERYGNSIVTEISQKQGELLPTRQINLEASRQRLMDHILPFVREYSQFELPCGGEASLSQEPGRIILAE